MIFLDEHVPFAVRTLVRFRLDPTLNFTEFFLDISLQQLQFGLLHALDVPYLGPREGYLV